MRAADNIRGRLRRGIGAQAYSQAVLVLIRLGEVPLFLHFWGAQLYGEWLMLAAIPAYLAIADGGFASAANREMAMLSGGGDRKGAIAVFQSTFMLLVVVSFASMVLATVAIFFLPFDLWFHFEAITPGKVKIVLFIFVLYVLTSFQGGLLNGGFWCCGKYPLAMALSASTTLLEFASLAIVVSLHGGPVQVAQAYLGGRIFGTLIILRAMRKSTPWLRYGVDSASIRLIGRLAAPAFASVAFPLGNAFYIQGMRLVVGFVLGPASLAIFAPLRTLSNLVVQARIVVNRLIQPELAVAYGNGNKKLFAHLFCRASQMAFWLAVLGSILLSAVAGWILPVWTAGKVEMNWPFFLTLLLAAIINTIWYTALMVPYATNRHGRIAIIYSGVYGVGRSRWAILECEFLG